MGISRREAFETLELPFGVDQDSVRTSYKRLAMKWHPDKHKNSPESIKNFLELSMAYKRLNIESDIVQMSVPDCLELFQQTINPPKPTYTNGFNLSEDDSEEEDEDDYEFLFQGKFGSSGLQRFPEPTQRSKLTPEEIEKNANELITEEEKEKRRAEKRRAKKKRRREKKRQEKVADQKTEDEGQKKKSNKKENGTDGKVRTEKGQNNSSESETDDFDRSAAFFTQVINKKKKSAVPESAGKSKDHLRSVNDSENTVDSDLDPVVLRSRQLAIEGNKMANVGEYQAAIDLFSEAVRLDPRDFRFFGNRSYCFDRLQQYEKALKDADKAILLAPDWPKGYFRKGRALAGLKLFADAEQSFMHVLKLDRNCEDAMSELIRVRTHQLTDMGFTQTEAQTAIRQYDSVQQALDSLLGGVSKLKISGEPSSSRGDLYNSDEEDYRGTTLQPPSRPPHPLLNPLPNQPLHPLPQAHNANTANQKPGDGKMNPANLEGLTALWVGNVLPEVTEKKLQTMFAKFGQVTSVRLLPEKYCAFINFKTKEDAGNAMKHLQSAPCAGQQLLIKFPDNPINSVSSTNNVVIRKGATTATPANTSTAKNSSRRTSQQQQQSQPNRFKKSGMLQDISNSNISTLTRPPSEQKQQPKQPQKPASQPQKPQPQKSQPKKNQKEKSQPQKLQKEKSQPQKRQPQKSQPKKSQPASPPKPPFVRVPKMSGPVNGDECYFWRTTGCNYGDQCLYEHRPDSQSIDLKPWHATN